MKTGSIPSYTFNKLWIHQFFALILLVSLFNCIIYETWFVIFAKTASKDFLYTYSVMLTHLSTILIISTFIVALICLNHINMIELRQRIDKFGVESKLEAILLLLVIDTVIISFIVFGFYFFIRHVPKPEVFYLYLFLHLVFNFVTMAIAYFLHYDLLNIQRNKELSEFNTY